MKTNSTKIDLSFFKKFRQYKSFSFDYNIVEKIWNNGNGSLKLIRFYPDTKIVLVNECLFNKSDEKHLTDFINQNNMNDWNIKKVYFGYSDYYTKDFSLNLLNNR